MHVYIVDKVLFFFFKKNTCSCKRVILALFLHVTFSHLFHLFHNYLLSGWITGIKGESQLRLSPLGLGWGTAPQVGCGQLIGQSSQARSAMLMQSTGALEASRGTGNHCHGESGGLGWKRRLKWELKEWRRSRNWPGEKWRGVGTAWRSCVVHPKEFRRRGQDEEGEGTDGDDRRAAGARQDLGGHAKKFGFQPEGWSIGFWGPFLL